MRNEPRFGQDRRPTLSPDFYWKFHAEDQRLMKANQYDYKNPEASINKMKAYLESIPDESLTEDELSDKYNALWLWYHHASQFAYGNREKDVAIQYIDKALEYRERLGLENQITPLLKLLYTGDLEGARAFAETIPAKVMQQKEDGWEEEIDNPELETAFALITHFERPNPDQR